ncbi:MAG TPA: PAS domain-containing protein [Stellaceae bacterium]|nr:PAS domain-containing protein [Stellaceae bacterium]
MAGEIRKVGPGETEDVAGYSYVIDPADVAQPILRPVLDYWDRKRGARPMPARLDIDPLELKAHLPHLFLIEPLAEAEFRYRLLGSEITERHGRNSTGKTLREAYADFPAVADWLTGMLLAVTTSKRPVLATGPLRAARKEHIFFEALHLPLSDDGVSVTMIFGAARYSPRARPAEASLPEP